MLYRQIIKLKGKMDKEDYIFKHQMGRENPFRVPEGYFEEFNKKIGKIITHPRHPSLTERLRQHRYVAAAAAAVLILVAGAFFVEDYFHTPQSEQQRAKVADYNDSINQILIDETSESLIEDYVIAEAN